MASSPPGGEDAEFFCSSADVLLGLTFINQKHMAGVTYIDRNQEDSSRIMTTIGSEYAYSPVWPSIKSIGTKAKIVVNDDVSSGTDNVRPVSMQAGI